VRYTLLCNGTPVGAVDLEFDAAGEASGALAPLPAFEDVRPVLRRFEDARPAFRRLRAATAEELAGELRPGVEALERAAALDFELADADGVLPLLLDVRVWDAGREGGPVVVQVGPPPDDDGGP